MNKAVPDVAALLLGAIAEAENGLGCGGGRFSQALLIASEPDISMSYES